MKTESTPTYIFGPLERRGILAGLRGGQIALIAVGVAGLVVGLIAGATLLGAVALTLGLAGAFLPMRGHTADEWAPIAGAYWWRRFVGGWRWRSDAALLGHVDGEPASPTLPPHLWGLWVLRTPAPGGRFGSLAQLAESPRSRVTAIR